VYNCPIFARVRQPEGMTGVSSCGAESLSFGMAMKGSMNEVMSAAWAGIIRMRWSSDIDAALHMAIKHT